MYLNDSKIRNAKPSEKNQKLADGGSLYLLITPTGSKLWQMAYRFAGKQKTLYFGAYPTVGLKDARERREETKKLLANGIDPGVAKKQAKTAAIDEARSGNTFESIAKEWLDTYASKVRPVTVDALSGRLKNHILPVFGNKRVNEMMPSDILDIARTVEKQGKIPLAHQIVHLCGQVLRYAVITGKTPYNIAVNLTEALQAKKHTHHAAILDQKRIGSLLRDIDTAYAPFHVICFLKILPYVFTRQSELRLAKWEEFTTDLWTIPADRMKTNMAFAIPLSRQVKEQIEILETYSKGRSEFLFPNRTANTKAMGANTARNALDRMGYKDEMTLHGFRAIASTHLNEIGYRPDVIEACLAHKERNAVRAAYNRAEYMEERRKLMQDWADYLDKLKGTK